MYFNDLFSSFIGELLLLIILCWHFFKFFVGLHCFSYIWCSRHLLKSLLFPFRWVILFGAVYYTRSHVLSWISCDPMDCSLPGSFIHEIFQARILEWASIFSFMGSSRHRNQTCISWVSRIAGRFFTCWDIQELEAPISFTIWDKKRKKI